jgi:ATP-dependent helicase HrpA
VHRLFHINIRNQEAFNAHVQAVRPTLVNSAKALVEKVGEVLRAFHQTRSMLHTIETANSTNREVKVLCTGIRADLVRLMPKDFLEQYSLDRFDHLSRYLKAMEVRVERGAYNVEKDKRKASEAEVFVKALNKMTEALSPYTSQEKRKSLETYRWMLEEFKVSLFAPELKTAFPVSKKRLGAKIREIERMA